MSDQAGDEVAATTDPLLALFLDIMEEHEFSINVTLAMGGLLVAGNPVGAKEYFESVGKLLDGANVQGNPVPERMWQNIFGQIAADAGEQFRARRDLERKSLENDQAPSEPAEIPERRWVYLKDVSILGAGPGPVSIPFWRGRLSDVSGWNFGGFNS